MARITSDRIARLRAARAAALTSRARDKALELVFAVGAGQFSVRVQQAIQGVITNKKDRPIPGVVFSAGRILFGDQVKAAIARVINKPGDVEAVVELVLVFPEQLVGTENNKLSPMLEALEHVGVDRDALLLVQDITLGSGKVARVFVRAATTGNQAIIIPELMVIVGQLWPEIEADVRGLQD